MDDLDLIKMHLFRTPENKLYALSKDSGVPYGTLWAIKKRKTKNPRYETVKTLSAYYKRAA
jgi:hypothetical protein